MKDCRDLFTFVKAYNSLTEILTDHRLAALGDAFINFAYSLAISTKRGHPSGAKVRGAVLAKAVRKARLREHMPSRISSHMMADAAEALIVYAWLQKHITLEECVAVLCKAESSVEGFTELLSKIKDRVTF
ncbi:MAG: ribonuclease III family protein [Candidatus Bathyarchaeia archaeon]